MHGAGRPWLGLLVMVVLPACGTARPATVAGSLPEGLDRFLREHPLGQAQGLRADEIGRTPAASWHIVQVATAEVPHRHRFHDLAVVVLRGRGVLTLDGRSIPMAPGDVALVARDRVHWFARRGDEPAVALVVHTPALDGLDFVPEPSPPGSDVESGQRVPDGR